MSEQVSSRVNLADLSREDIEAMDWYYKIELKPGAFTNGRVRGTASMTRDVIRNINLKGARCLDLGAQECLLTTMLARQGASYVAAYDRLNLTDRINLIKAAYAVDFDYYHSLQLNELPARLKAEGKGPFDVVIFAGVLYHMMDPIAGLATARSFVREGGLMVVESSVLATSEYTAAINAKGRLYSGSNYFQLSLSSLEYFMRMLRLRPIDLLFTKPRDDGICRAIIVGRAVKSVVPTSDDWWMRKQFLLLDVQAAHLYYNALQSDAKPITYRSINRSLKTYENCKLIDIWGSYEASQPHRAKQENGQMRLSDQS